MIKVSGNHLFIVWSDNPNAWMRFVCVIFFGADKDCGCLFACALFFAMACSCFTNNRLSNWRSNQVAHWYGKSGKVKNEACIPRQPTQTHILFNKDLYSQHALVVWGWQCLAVPNYDPCKRRCANTAKRTMIARMWRLGFLPKISPNIERLM